MNDYCYDGQFSSVIYILDEINTKLGKLMENQSNPKIQEAFRDAEEISKRMKTTVYILKTELIENIDTLKRELTEHVNMELKRLADSTNYNFKKNG